MMGPLETRIERPLGREGKIELILDEVGHRGTCYVIGAAGIGKSMVLREVRRRLDEEGVEVVAISGREATALVPLAPLLRLCPPGADDAGAAIIAELYRRSRTSEIVVIVDDAHLLDGATAAIVRQLAGADLIGLVVAHRRGEPAPTAIRSIREEELGREIELAPLDRRSASELTEQILGATESDTLEWIWAHGRGHPLYTRELIVAGTQTGALQLSNGSWRAREGPVWTSRLHSLLARRLADLTPDERSVLQLTAVGGRLPVDILEQASDLETVFELERRTLLLIEDQAAEMGHPLYGTAILATMSPEQVRTARLHIADALESSESHRDLVVIASLRMDAGAPVDEELLWSALRSARDTRLPERAERFSRRLLEIRDDPGTRMMLCQALATQGRWSEAESEFESVVTRTDPDDRPGFLEQWALLNFELRHSLSDAEAVARRAAPEIGDRGSETWEMTLLRLRLFTENLDQTVEENRAWLVRRPASPLGDLALINLATAASHSGAFADGLAASRELGRPLDLDPVERSRIDGVAMHITAWCYGHEAASPLMEDALQRDAASGDPERELLARIYNGIVSNDLTRTAEALVHLRRTAEMERYMHRRRSISLILGEMARATAGIEGGEAEARRWLRRLFELPAEDLWVAQPIGKLAEAILAGREGEDPFPALSEGLEHARRRSARIHEVPLLRQVAQLGGAHQVAHRLEEITEFMGGGLAGLVNREARGLAERDAALLDDVAVEAWRFGAVGLASDAAAWAAGFHLERGDARAALLAEMRSDAIVADQPVRTVARDGMTRGLSDRERQVVRSVAGGASNREVADRLFISHRTVESHLRRVYRRFGIDDREELAQLVQTAVTPPRRSG